MSALGRHRSGQHPPSLLRGWQTQPLSLTVLRGFLGVTFLYAGIQKLADPAFFDSTSPMYIGAQLEGFSRGSPIGPVLHLLSRAPVAAGVLVALTEIAIGLATLLGIGMLVAAAAGFGLSLMLWLSASWHVYPYFLGSDSIYAVAWLALGVGIWEMNKRRRGTGSSSKARRVQSSVPWQPSRREFIRGGALSLLTLVAGGAAWAMGTAAMSSTASAAPATATRASTRVADRATSSPSSAPPVASSSAPAAQAPAAPPPPAGVKIASFDRLNVGDAVPFNAPGVGACALVRTGEASCDAFSRTCTHEGCEVGWNPSAGLLVCPCHGAEFDPSQGGQPVAGPAMRPLERVKVVVDRGTGDVYLPQ